MTALRDLLGIVLIGDGIVGAAIPRRHTRRYERGPGWWRAAMRFFAQRPSLVQALAAAEVAAGASIALARRSHAR